MENWTEGYVAEIDYAQAYYAEMAPAHLSFALLLNGIRPPVEPGAGFAYAELGCGQGLTSNLLACLYPGSHFEAMDFLPSHIAGARRLAAECGNLNAQFSDDSFADFARRETADFDIIALHGVWSWISEDNRRTLVKILRQRLKPGGAVYVSYNCLPGWAAHMPIRQLLRQHVAASSAPMTERIGNALRFVHGLAELDSGYFAQVPSAIAHLNGLDLKSDSYIAHEYLNRDWAPFYHADVAGDLAAAKLSYGASATLLDNDESWSLDTAAQARLKATDDPTLRETLRDTLSYRRFRRDIFVKGPQHLPAAEREALLRATRVGLCVAADEVPLMFKSPCGERPVPPALVEALAQGPQTLDHLAQGNDFADILRAVTLLIGEGLAVPLPGGDVAERLPGAQRFNAAALRRNRYGPDIRQLASPVLGGGVMVGLIERLFLLARLEGCDPVAFAWTILAERGKRLRAGGEELTSTEENLAELTRHYCAFESGPLPLLQGLGIA
jgi:SAM-dependent methyltransferase